MSYAYNLWIDHDNRAAENGNCHAKHLHYRHAGNEQRVNIAFADGHAETFSRDQIYIQTKQRTKNVIWNPHQPDY